MHLVFQAKKAKFCNQIRMIFLSFEFSNNVLLHLSLFGMEKSFYELKELKKEKLFNYIPWGLARSLYKMAK